MVTLVVVLPIVCHRHGLDMPSILMIFNVEEAEAKLNGSDGDNVNAGECHPIEASSSGENAKMMSCAVRILLSIWTVDLAYLLQKFSVTFAYFTVTIGANPNYSAETFYKEQLPTDLVRVDRLFQKAREEGINIQCRSINEKEISLLILSGKYIAIALVDQYKLSRSWMEDFILSGLNDSNSNYTGHYVVICGYDAGADEFEIRDPASSSSLVNLVTIG
ncbi:hypothetical protein GH714_036479 [Hevea brasiliensis]|uniref:Uncharacterized protein n=1 Tax=Hevea brasiliensis TaxID=3981 RepID=A0A6A6L5B1_HEVBR|nr:hypothetical protein GH714_036479 [Hevea brasiliensis]